MKKSVIKLLTALLIFILVFSLGSCGEDNFILSEEMEMEIKEAYLANSKNDKLTIDDIAIRHYLGTYHGSSAIIIKGNCLAIPVLKGANVAGTIFLWPNEDIGGQEPIVIYKAGHFYDLLDAYKLGLLTKKDVKKLAERFWATYPQLNPNGVDLTDWLIRE